MCFLFCIFLSRRPSARPRPRRRRRSRSHGRRIVKGQTYDNNNNDTTTTTATTILLLLIIIRISISLSTEVRKGTDGVSTNGFTANYMFFDREAFWALPLTYFYLPPQKVARAYLFSDSVKIHYFYSLPKDLDTTDGASGSEAPTIIIIITIIIYHINDTTYSNQYNIM